MVEGVLRTAGHPLPTAVRAEMEGRLGHEFSGVRLHTDSQADTAAQAVEADAFTSGQHIVFRRAQYSDTTASGKHLLAHELTHVVQQRSGTVVGSQDSSGLAISEPQDHSEREAEFSATRAMAAGRGAAPPESGTGASRVQRSGAQTSVQRQLRRIGKALDAEAAVEQYQNAGGTAPYGEDVMKWVIGRLTSNSVAYDLTAPGFVDYVDTMSRSFAGEVPQQNGQQAPGQAGAEGATVQSRVRIVGDPLTVRQAIDWYTENFDPEGSQVPAPIQVIEHLVTSPYSFDLDDNGLMQEISNRRDGYGGPTTHDWYQQELANLRARLGNGTLSVHVVDYGILNNLLDEDNPHPGVVQVEQGHDELAVDGHIGTNYLDPCVAVGVTGMYQGRRYTVVHHADGVLSAGQVMTQMNQRLVDNGVPNGRNGLEGLQSFLIGGNPSAVNNQLALLESLDQAGVTDVSLHLTNQPGQEDLIKAVLVLPNGQVRWGHA